MGKTYTRKEITAAFCGSPYQYLPSKAGQTLYGCFNPPMNPNAPDEVLVGSGPTIQQQAETFAEQGRSEAVPIFMKRAPKKWKYVGTYGCDRLSRAPNEVAPRARAAGRENDVVAVL